METVVAQVVTYLKAKHKREGYVPLGCKVNTDPEKEYRYLAMKWIMERARDALLERGALS